MNHFEARLMVLSQKVDSNVLRVAVQLKYFDEKRAKWRLQCLNFRRFVFGMRNSDVPTVKVRVLTSDFEF